MSHHVPGLEAAGVRSLLTLRYSDKLDLSCLKNKRITFFVGSIILAALNIKKRNPPKVATIVRTVSPQNG